MEGLRHYYYYYYYYYYCYYYERGEITKHNWYTVGKRLLIFFFTDRKLSLSYAQQKLNSHVSYHYQRTVPCGAAAEGAERHKHYRADWWQWLYRARVGHPCNSPAHMGRLELAEDTSYSHSRVPSQCYVPTFYSNHLWVAFLTKFCKLIPFPIRESHLV